VRPQGQLSRPQAPRPEERALSRPQNTPPAHPLVRQAAPVQERPEHQQNEEQKFRQWQQQRPQAAPAPPPRAPERKSSPPPKEEKRK
jgi:hypothetical protein